MSDSIPARPLGVAESPAPNDPSVMSPLWAAALHLTCNVGVQVVYPLPVEVTARPLVLFLTTAGDPGAESSVVSLRVDREGQLAPATLLPQDVLTWSRVPLCVRYSLSLAVVAGHDSATITRGRYFYSLYREA